VEARENVIPAVWQQLEQEEQLHQLGVLRMNSVTVRTGQAPHRLGARNASAHNRPSAKAEASERCRLHVTTRQRSR